MKRSEYVGFAAAIVSLTIVLAVFRNRINTAQAIEIIITFALVLITVVYVKRTAEIAKASELQAKASAEMIVETQRQRHAAFRPILNIEGDIGELDPRDRPETVRHLYSERGNFPPSWPCKRISNIGVGPALDVQWLSHLGSAGFTGQDAIHPRNVSVVGVGKPVEDVQCYLLLEDIQEEQNRKVVRVKYKDVFGNQFESRREVWMKGKYLSIGPLQLLPKENQ